MRNSVSLFHSLSAARADREKRAQWPRIVTISYGPFSQIKCFISLHTHTHTLIRLPLGQVFSDPVPGITSLIWLMSKSSLYRKIIPKKKKKIFNMTTFMLQHTQNYDDDNKLSDLYVLETHKKHQKTLFIWLEFI